ncbi:MAG TPA: PKD domain-containing protein, partial [Candidatus Limnocylindria bacterium]|nr:PKD domain-containing protein [Candidatus Limnocylindria bacterium]
GYPNPYSATLQTAWNNGWGLNRIAGADSADPTGHGHNLSTQMIYCGEAAIEGKPKPSSVSWSQWCAGGPIHPAPGFVMVFSNACYTPGAGESESTTPTSESVARTRVQYFSRPYLALGGNYFASDLGSRSVVEAILDNPDRSLGDIFEMGNGYSPSAQRHFPHALSSGDEAWIQRTSGPGGLMSYWYAFAGDPNEAPGPTAPIADFTATPTSGIEQLWVAFDNETVTFGPTTWAWDFTSDGTTDSTARDPSWTYPTAGTYTVSLTATNSLGTDSVTKSGYVTVTAPQPTTYVPVTPARVLDTRFNNGLSGPFQANAPRTFQVAGTGGVPANATAVTGNLTVTAQSGPGYVYLGPSALPNPPTSSVNFPFGDSRGNAVTVALGPGGTLSATLAATSSTHLVFDVTGYFVPNATGAGYAAVTPARLLDTRNGTGLAGPVMTNTPRTFQVTGLGGVPTNAMAVTGNVTVTGQSGAGWVVLGPDPVSDPTTSTVNFPYGDSRGNAVTLALGPGGTLSATLAAATSTHLVFDVTGYFLPGAAGAWFVPLSPSRVVDTRYGTGLSGPFTAYSPRTFQVAGLGGVQSTAQAVTGNATVTGQSAAGWIVLGPDPVADPTTSTVNFPYGDARGNAVTLALGPGGTLSGTLAAASSTHLVFDVTGYFKLIGP